MVEIVCVIFTSSLRYLSIYCLIKNIFGVIYEELFEDTYRIDLLIDYFIVYAFCVYMGYISDFISIELVDIQLFLSSTSAPYFYLHALT